MKKIFIFVIFGVLISCNLMGEKVMSDDVESFYEQARVVGNVYADTIRVNVNGRIKTVKMLGVDTADNPESKIMDSYVAKEAADYTKFVLSYNSIVYLTYDSVEQDKYNRTLAYVWYKVDGVWILHNLNLILNGYGRISNAYPLKREYDTLFKETQEAAKDESLGFWKRENAKNEMEIVISSSTDRIRISSVKYTGVPLYVEIRNVDSQPVKLNRWFLFSVSTKRTYLLNEITISPMKTLKVYFGPDSSGNLIWSKDIILNPSGDGVILYNEKGEQVSFYSWGF